MRRRFVGRATATIVAEVARFHRCRLADTPREAARYKLCSLARRWLDLDAEISELDAQLDELTAEAAPTLRAINGVGIQVATGVNTGT